MAGIATSTGLVSGINYQNIVDQLAQVEQQPITLLQDKEKKLQSVSAELSTLSIKLSSLNDAATSLSALSSFNPNTVNVSTTSAGVTLLNASADSTAAPGLHQVTVDQLAQANSIASQGFVDADTTPVASAAGTFEFKVGVTGAVTQVNVTSDMTLSQLRDAINAVDPGVKASIINDGSGSNPYRLVLTAKDSGSANTIFVTQNPTTLDFTNKKVAAAYASTSNSYSGTVTSNEGNNYTGTTNKTFLVKIVSGGDPGTATYKYSIDGGVTFLGANGAAYDGTNAITTQTSLSKYIDGKTQSNDANEGVQVSFGAGTGTLVAGDTFSIDAFAPTLQAAQDAVVQIGNLTVTKPTNTITDVIQGVTLNLLKADSSQPIDVSIGTDTSGITDSLNKFITAYNDVLSYLNDQLSYDPNSGQAAKPLLGDTTAVLLKRQLQDLVTSIVPGSSSGLNSLAQLGFKTDPQTSQLSLDDATFNAALGQNVSDVTRLFVGLGVPSNSAIHFVSKTDNTRPGVYGINIMTAPAKATVQGSHAVPSGGITTAETISVNLFSNATSSTDTPTTAQVTVAAGSTANDIVNALNSAFATKNMAVSASNNNGVLQIASTNYGADYKVQVQSTVTDSADQSGIGTTTLESQGVDIAGTINGFKANGKGAVLTSGSGFGDDGLSIRAEVPTTGSYGTVTVSSGVADRMASLLQAAVNPTTGNIKVRQDGITTQINDLNNQIDKKNQEVSDFKQQTLARFQRLEVLLGQYKTQGDALTNSLVGLTNLSTQISLR